MCLLFSFFFLEHPCLSAVVQLVLVNCHWILSMFRFFRLPRIHSVLEIQFIKFSNCVKTHSSLLHLFPD